MRREGYEFEVSKPEAITKIVDGQIMEPMEAMTIDTTEEYIGGADRDVKQAAGPDDEHVQ